MASSQRFSATLFIVVALMIVLIPVVSAFEFDNQKFYDEETDTITIKNCALWIGTCWIDGAVLAEYTLTENTDYCLNDCYAEGNATLGGEQVLFQDTEFRNRNGNLKEINEFKWFIEVEDREDSMIPTYEDECGHFFGNGTEYCIKVQNGTKEWEVVKYEWQRYFGTQLPAGDYKWRLEGRKDFGESVDWIASSNGMDLTEWAWWNGDWTKKKLVNITNSESAQANYTTLMNVTYDSDMETDFGDLRFVNSAEDTELKYWIENQTNSNAATVWVFLDEIGAGLNEIYMYYGKSGASTTSNIKTAFRHGDDFTDNSFDTSQWYLHPSTAAGETVGILKVSGSGDVGNAQVHGTLGNSVNFTQYPYKLTFSVSSTNQGSYTSFFGINGDNAGGLIGTASQEMNMITLSKSSPYKMRVLKTDSYVEPELATGWTTNTLYKGSIVTYTNGSMTGTYDGIGSQFANNNLQTDPYRIVYATQDGGNISIDYSYLNGYLAVEPIITFGAEAEDTLFTVISISPVDSFNATITSVDFTCNATDAVGVKSLNLTVNNSILETVTGPGTTNLSIDTSETIAEGYWEWNCTGNNAGSTAQSATRYFTVDTTPFIDYNTPPTQVDNYVSTTPYIPVDITLTETYFQNITFTFSNGTAYTFTDGTRDINYSFADGSYNYNVTTCTSTGRCNITTSRDISIDSNIPTITLESPSGVYGSGLVSQNVTLNVTSTDVNLDTCWYDYNSTNITIDGCLTGVKNSTLFILEENNRNITVWTNDTFGNINSEMSSWSYDMLEVSQVYPSNSIESAIEVYGAEVEYNSSAFSIIAGTLTLNGTEYSGTRTGSGNNGTFTTSATMPVISAQTNFTAYWTIGLTNATNTYEYNLTSNNVTVEVINLSLCDGSLTVPFWNFTVLNESNNAEINTTFEGTFTVSPTGSTAENTFSYEDATGLNSQYDFCMSPTTESYTIGTNIKLTKTNFVDKFYNYEEIVVTNATREDNLYMLLSDDSTSFIVHVVDVSATDITDAEVRVQRYYPGTGDWVTTEILTTNYVGEAVGHLLSEDADYRFLIYQSGVSVYNSSATKITCAVTPCTVTLTIPLTVLSGYETPENLVTSLTFSSTTNVFTYTYSDTSGLFTNARLEVLRVWPSNATQIRPCDEVKTSASGIITCDISGNVNGTYQASGYITRDSDEFLSERIAGNIGTSIFNAIGSDGILWSFFIFIAIIMLGIARPSMAIIFGVVGVITLSLIGLVNIGAISIVAITAMAIILLMRTKQE